MMIERVLSLEGGYVAPRSHCASWSCQRTHHHYIGQDQDQVGVVERGHGQDVVGRGNVPSVMAPRHTAPAVNSRSNVTNSQVASLTHERCSMTSTQYTPAVYYWCT